MIDLKSKKEINLRADVIFQKCLLVTRQREKEYAKADAISMCNQIMISLEDCNAPIELIQHWNAVKKELEKL